jgi:hypothetical protein
MGMDELRFFRGLLNGLLISIPLWAIIIWSIVKLVD